MDLAGGTILYEGIELLRLVETGNKKYFRNSIFDLAVLKFKKLQEILNLQVE